MPEKEALFERFKKAAEALTVRVIRCDSADAAKDAIVSEVLQQGYRQVVSVPLDSIDIEAIKKGLEAKGINCAIELSRDIVEQADLGISEYDFGIAELGCVAQDATDVYKRLVSSLCPVHLAIIRTHTLVDTFEDSLSLLKDKYGDQVPAYFAYVAGPSKTADIERVLTIGVHGPGKIIVICID